MTSWPVELTSESDLPPSAIRFGLRWRRPAMNKTHHRKWHSFIFENGLATVMARKMHRRSTGRWAHRLVATVSLPLESVLKVVPNGGKYPSGDVLYGDPISSLRYRQGRSAFITGLAS